MNNIYVEWYLGSRYTYHEDTGCGRILFIFNGEPLPEVRELMASNGFSYDSDRSGAEGGVVYGRKLTANAMRASWRAKAEMDELAFSGRRKSSRGGSQGGGVNGNR